MRTRNEWWHQYEETAARLHDAGDYRAADDIRTLVDGLKQHEADRDRLAEENRYLREKWESLPEDVARAIKAGLSNPDGEEEH